MAKPVDWGKIESVVQKGSYSDAGDEFALLKNKVLKSTPDELDQDAAQAKLAWKFLVGFGTHKRAHRNLVAQVVRKLSNCPSWCAAYQQVHADLVAEVEQLHPDLRAAFGLCETTCGEATVRKPSDLMDQWPEWIVIERKVEEDSCPGASDEFSAVRARILKSPPEEIEGQIRHAAVFWHFLLSFAEVRTTHRKLVVEVIEHLKKCGGWYGDGWMDEFNSSEKLKAKGATLHQDIQVALGVGQAQTASFRRSLTLDERVSSALGNPERKDSREQEEQSLPPLLPDDMPQASSAAAPATAAAPAVAAAPMAATANPIGPIITKCQAYIQQAAALDATRPEAAYYCRRWVVEILMKAMQEGVKSGESTTLLMATLERCEAVQSFITPSAQHNMEALASEVYDQALTAPDAVSRFYLAGLLLDATAQFYDGQLPGPLAEKAAAAKFRATSHTGGAVRLPPPVAAAAPPQPTAPLAPAQPAPPAAQPPAPVPPAQPAAPPPAAAFTPYGPPAQPPAPMMPPAAPASLAPAPAPAGAVPRATGAKAKKAAMAKAEKAAAKLGDVGSDVKGAKALMIEALELLQQ